MNIQGDNKDKTCVANLASVHKCHYISLSFPAGKVSPQDHKEKREAKQLYLNSRDL